MELMGTNGVGQRGKNVCLSQQKLMGNEWGSQLIKPTLRVWAAPPLEPGPLKAEPPQGSQGSKGV